MSDKKLEVVRSYDDEGNETFVLKEEGEELGINMTMGDIYEARNPETVNLPPQKILEMRAKMLADDKGKVQKSRLVSNNAIFTNKKTGETYTLKQGGMPTMEDRKRFDMTGAMVGLVKQGTEELLTIIVPFKKDGTIPESFAFDVVELPEILTFEVKSEQ